MRVVSRFPGVWLTEVTVLRGGGRDERGDPIPVQEIPIQQCLLASRSTESPNDRSDLTSSDGILYRDLDPDFDFESSDRIRVPEGTWLKAGEWAVDGDPKRWPSGWEVPLRLEP